MSPQDQLVRTCSVCGQAKPLSAFLQISGSQGTVYGTICAPCKSITKEKKPATPEEGRDSTTAGNRIGAKQKADIEKKQKLTFQELERIHIDKRLERDKLSSKKEEKIDQIKQYEQKHRQTYLEQKKSFLDNKKAPDSKQAATKDQAIQKIQTTTTSQRQQYSVTESKNREVANALETILTTLNMQRPFVPGQSWEMNKNPEFLKKLFALMGGNPLLAEPIRRMLSKNSALSSRANQNNTNNTPESPGEAYLVKNFTPGRK